MTPCSTLRGLSRSIHPIIQARYFAWVVPHYPSHHTGAIYLRERSKLIVTEGGRVSFVNNHAAHSGGKHCYPYPRYTTISFFSRSPCLSRCLTSLFCSVCSKATNPSSFFFVRCHTSIWSKCFQQPRHCVVRIQQGGILWRCDV